MSLINLVSFADTNLVKSAMRLKKQALSFNLFDKILIYNQLDLPVHFKHQKFLKSEVRLFGYCCWKPSIILKAMSALKENDLLLYVDVGCHLNLNGKNRLEEYFEILKNSIGILAFQAIPPDKKNSRIKYDGRKLPLFPNYHWIKGDVLDYFNLRNDEIFLNSFPTGAGIILFKKCDFTIKVLNEWKQIIDYDIRLIDDSPSISKNINGFIESRHDQAIFSALNYKYTFDVLSSFEYWYPLNNNLQPKLADWKALQKFPIHAKRDKKFNISLYIKKKINSIISKLKYFGQST